MGSSGIVLSNPLNKEQLCDIPCGVAYFGSDHCVDSMRRNQQRTRLFYRFALLLVSTFTVINFKFYTWIPSNGRAHCQDMKIKSNLNDPDFFNWTAHPPSTMLNWTECYGSFQCSRLTVPLQYSEPDGTEGAVALIKSPSKYPPGHDQYRGPILFNPGGPGGSGVMFLRSFEQPFREILSDKFDFIGFDPRGIGFTTPIFSAFESEFEASKFNLQYPININTSTSAIGEAYASSHIIGRLSADRSKYLAEHISTPSVARDMFRIIKAAGQDKLQYWGFSYGTTLGATFAAMFPDNVGRIILDGVTNMDDYYSGDWSNHLWDADTAFVDILQSCVEAGPSVCPIYENSLSKIQARVERLLDKLRFAPVLVSTTTGPSAHTEYDIVDYALVKSAIFRTLYKTHKTGALLADALAALEQGDGSNIYAISEKRGSHSPLSCGCPEAGSSLIPKAAHPEIVRAIACGDADKNNMGLEELRKSYTDLAETTSFADVWLALSYCTGWSLQAKDRFNGSFEQTTSHPLLFIGNIADPVTPVRNAHRMSMGFKESVVLTQNSSGHGSVAATSLCTIQYVRDYIINGTLPNEGTICEVLSSIFGGNGARINIANVSFGERKLIEASQTLQENYFIPPIWDTFEGV